MDSMVEDGKSIQDSIIMDKPIMKKGGDSAVAPRKPKDGVHYFLIGQTDKKASPKWAEISGEDHFYEV